MLRLRNLAVVLAAFVAVIGFSNAAFGQGACCYTDGTCTNEADEGTCTGLGGTWQGPGTACADNSGACCYADGSCQDETDELCCEAAGGTWYETAYCLGDANGDGKDDLCQIKRPIPTLTRPGAAVLALLLVIAAVIVLRRWRTERA